MCDVSYSRDYYYGRNSQGTDLGIDNDQSDFNN